MTIRGLHAFLHDYPGMAVQPIRARTSTIIEGKFRFAANDEIRDTYQLRISIPQSFPWDVPSVTEIGGRIPRTGDFHVNPDNTLCLGSPLRIKKILSDRADIVSFAELCLVPYLYRVSAALQRGDRLAGLAHGTPGVLDDYAGLFGLSSAEQVLAALRMLKLKKRIANKKYCPCRCGRRLGSCPLHFRLNGFRLVAPRSWFSRHARELALTRTTKVLASN